MVSMASMHILCVSDPMFFYALNVMVCFIFPYAMNTQVHDTTKQTPYELVFGQPPRAIAVPYVNFRDSLMKMF